MNSMTTVRFVCLFVLRVNVPVNNFQSCRDGATASWVLNQYFRGVKSLVQGHNTAEVGFEPRPLAPESDTLHSTTEPPRSPNSQVWILNYFRWTSVLLSYLNDYKVQEFFFVFFVVLLIF